MKRIRTHFLGKVYSLILAGCVAVSTALVAVPATVQAEKAVYVQASQEYTNLSTKTTWQVTFDKDLDKSTVTTNNITITDKDGNAQSITVTYSTKKYITVKPKKPLAKKAEFTLKVDQIKDKNGNFLGKMEIKFTTGTSTSSKTVKVKFASEETGGGDQTEIDRLRKENEQLKSQIRSLEAEIERLRERIRELENGGGSGDQDNTPLTHEYFTVTYPKGYKDEANNMYKYMEESVKAAKEEFGNLVDVERWLKQPKPVTIVIHDKPDDKADVGLWSLYGLNDGSFEIHLLGKKAHYVRCCTNVGKEYDDLYFKVTTIHEYLSIPLRKAVGEKKKGWSNLYSAPEWFVQGMEEYYGYHYGNDPETIRILTQRVKDDRNRIKFSSSGITVQGTYEDGAVLAFFLYETYGKTKVQNVLMSKEPKWEKAFLKEFGSYSDMEKAFNNWLSKK
ncbi:Ig-like domain-containing protein [Brevibacillus composti]|uniref:Ig-like domain-containing protein n=1 Tax=Brevibacillus composti TaxID=2796470 RepID=A0A7T5EKA7_9BACL|nr:Ig-like domain-containing protein [Brevibacillus composti]QQE74168.1 Ig-like domain-containing protein [Brevibacillus composti]QUO41251.1 Ig-like domain-containing protein [Brevibacillus composti]